jgi:hypothetical protein
MTELIRRPEGGYTTPDGRWRVQRNAGRRVCACAPVRWWAITDTSGDFRIAATPTLADVKKYVAAIEQVEA